MAAFPSITPDSMTMSSINPTRMNRTLNGIVQRTASTGQYFIFSAAFGNLSQSEQRQISAHIDAQSGPLQSFALTLPSYLGNSTGDYSGSISTNGTNSVGATTIGITATGTYPTLKAGDLIQFANHDKLYTVTADVNSPGTSISISPPLRTAVTSGSAVKHKNLTATVRYTTDNLEFSIGLEQFPSFNLEFEEVLS